MKTKHIKQAIVALVCAAVCAGFAACETDPVEMKGGKLPDKEAIEQIHGKLRSAASTDNSIDVLLTEGNGFATKDFYFQQSKPAVSGFSLAAWIDNTMLGDYNSVEEVERQLLPEANYEFPDGKTLELSADGQRSDLKRIKFLASGLTAGEYVLPLTVAENGTSDADKTLFYNVSVRQPYTGQFALHDGHDLFFVFYINTNDFQPLLVQDYIMRKKQARGPIVAWHDTVGNIVNLRTVTIGYEAATGRALLDLGADMRYVLDHADKYIRPLQEENRKICICLEGGGKGLGFCNLDDRQIADFVAQVKAVVTEYELDGINLWDRNAGYGKAGMPAMNTTSYPKLIKALREALGTEKLLTVTVYEKPTESFYDVAASGGIAVGDYVDYAWSGYNDYAESPQLLDPWHPELEYVSAYTQKPIANLDPSKYGCINFPIYPQNSFNEELEFLLDWVPNYRPNNLIVFDDLHTNLQDNYEAVWDGIFATCCMYMDPENRELLGSRAGYNYMLDKHWLTLLPDGNLNYGKWKKDW